jgi:hypothetical protein
VAPIFLPAARGAKWSFQFILCGGVLVGGVFIGGVLVASLIARPSSPGVCNSSRHPCTTKPSMIPAATSVCRPQNADPGTARREQGRHASRDPTSAENAWHFFLGMCEMLRSV